jgi:hypothetical protein
MVAMHQKRMGASLLLGISTSKLEELTCSVLTQFAIKLVVL